MPQGHPSPESDPREDRAEHLTGPGRLIAAAGLWVAWPAMIITGLLVFAGAFNAFRDGMAGGTQARLTSFAGVLLIPAAPLAVLYLLRKQPFILPFRTAAAWYLAVEVFSALAHLAAPVG